MQIFVYFMRASNLAVLQGFKDLHSFQFPSSLLFGKCLSEGDALGVCRVGALITLLTKNTKRAAVIEHRYNLGHKTKV